MELMEFLPNFVEIKEYIDEDGKLHEFKFKASLETFVLFKSITGFCLVEELKKVNLKMLEVMQNEDFDKAVQFIGKEKEEQAEMLKNDKELMRVVIKLSQELNDVGVCGKYEFYDALILSMFIAGLPKNYKEEALAKGLRLIPNEFLEDLNFRQQLVANMFRIEKGLKKKGYTTAKLRTV